MFGFLKGKNKSKSNHSNQEINGKLQSKEKNRKQTKEKRDRQKQKLSKDAGSASNSLFKKGTTLPARRSSPYDDSSCKSTSTLSNGTPSSYSYDSLDQISSSEITSTVSDVSELNSKSSSCFNNYTVSNSSSRASIPSITTEFVEDNLSSSIEITPIPFASKVNNSASTTPNFHNCNQVHSSESTEEILSREDLKQNSSVNRYFQKASALESKPGLTLKPPLTPKKNPELVKRPDISRLRDEDDSSISSSIQSPTKSCNSSSIALECVCPTSFHADGSSTSMLSTPSGSTSSLSSLSLLPPSPSGRRTPPGPRMGTSPKLGSSPTPSRKSPRTAIKTNPKISPSLTNYSFKPMNTALIPENTTLPTLRTALDAKVALASTLSNIDQSMSMLNRSESKLNPNMEGPHSKETIGETNNRAVISSSSSFNSTQNGRLRHSITSVHSLESIPEFESENTPNSEIKKTDKSPERLPLLPEENCSVQNKLPADVSELGKENDQPANIITNSDNNTRQLSTKEALSALCKTIAQEKHFASNIMKEFMETKNDDDSSESSLREPEVKEHRLQLVPNSIEMKNNITFTMEEVPCETSTFCAGEPECDSTIGDPTILSDPDSSSSMSPYSVEPTHAVFQIPLRSKSCSRERTLSPSSHVDSNVSENDAQQQRCCDYTKREDEISVNAGSAEKSVVDVSEVHCVEGHVELNFDRGRSSRRSPTFTSRKRSTSSARRQKLYEDIKKFTAQTKEAQVIGQTKQNLPPKGSDLKNVSETKKSNKFTDNIGKESNLSEVSKKLWGENRRNLSLDRTASKRSTTGQRTKASNTLPRPTSMKKLERSITVAEIKINVNSKTSLPVDASHECSSEISENKRNEQSEAKEYNFAKVNNEKSDEYHSTSNKEDISEITIEPQSKLTNNQSLATISINDSVQENEETAELLTKYEPPEVYQKIALNISSTDNIDQYNKEIKQTPDIIIPISNNLQEKMNNCRTLCNEKQSVDHLSRDSKCDDLISDCKYNSICQSDQGMLTDFDYESHQRNVENSEQYLTSISNHNHLRAADNNSLTDSMHQLANSRPGTHSQAIEYATITYSIPGDQGIETVPVSKMK